VPQSPPWEYTYRWAEVDLSEEKLEARDTQLELYLKDFGSCSIDFEFTYRWDQIFAEADANAQIAMLEARDVELEMAIRESGGCEFEYPYRWAQYWEDLLAGEPNAINMAEENDRTLEGMFINCSCGKVSEWVYESNGPVPTADSTLLATDNAVVPESIPAGSMLSIFMDTFNEGNMTYRLVRVSDSFVIVTKTFAYVGGITTNDSTSVPAVSAGTTVRLEISYTVTDADALNNVIVDWFTGVDSTEDDAFTFWDVP